MIRCERTVRTSSEDDSLSPAMLMAWEFRVPRGMVMVMVMVNKSSRKREEEVEEKGN